ncbi:MAG: hypothetical protein JWQ35_545 [Bacteriovoracaceae bacterium]|nr:hypothetical protein [Bacteriovoracaceae bacterium]
MFGNQNKFLILTAILLLPVNLFADMVSINPRPRMESMGGAGVATLGDQDSAMMNPASLSDVEKSKVEVFPLTLEAPFDLGTLNSFLDYNDVRGNPAKTTTDKKKALTSFLSDAAIEATAARINIYPSYTRKYMHIGLLMDMYVDPRLRVGGITGNEVMELGGSSGTAGLILGGGYSFLQDQLQVGMTVKPIYRVSITEQANQTLHDVVLGLNKDADAAGNPPPNVSDQLFGKSKGKNRAYAVGVDLGVKYFIPYFKNLKPTVGLTYQDIGDTRFVGDKSLPADIPQSISVGIALHPNWSIFKNTFALDIRNMNQEEDFLNKFHFGAETVIWNLLAVRAGVAQGYLTGGLGFISKLFEADVYIASREAGRYSHIQDITTIGMRLALGW